MGENKGVRVDSEYAALQQPARDVAQQACRESFRAATNALLGAGGVGKTSLAFRSSWPGLSGRLGHYDIYGRQTGSSWPGLSGRLGHYEIGSRYDHYEIGNRYLGRSWDAGTHFDHYGTGAGSSWPDSLAFQGGGGVGKASLLRAMQAFAEAVELCQTAIPGGQGIAEDASHRLRTALEEVGSTGPTRDCLHLAPHQGRPEDSTLASAAADSQDAVLKAEQELRHSWRDLTREVTALGVRQVLRQWRDLASSATGVLQDSARLAFVTALETRAAVLVGDEASVNGFVGTWMGLAPTPPLVDGVQAALLEEGWAEQEGRDPPELAAAVARLRAEIRAQHRVHRPVWETQLHGQRIALLYQPVRGLGPGVDGRRVELIDLLADERAAMEGRLLSASGYRDPDPRLDLVVRTLQPADRRIVSALADGAPTWVQAASDCGFSAHDGELARRRVKRRAAEVDQRARASRTTRAATG